LLYSYKFFARTNTSANTDANTLECLSLQPTSPEFTCFTGTKVQILTLRAAFAEKMAPSSTAGAGPALAEVVPFSGKKAAPKKKAKPAL
jgi:hypothetical protein